MSDTTTPGVGDQARKQSHDDQPAKTDNSAGNQEQPETDSQLYEVNGEMLTLEQLREGYMKGADYTKKTQELGREKRKWARNPVDEQPSETTEDDPEFSKAIDLLKSKGKFVTREELERERERIQIQFEDKQNLDRIIVANPELKAKRKAIEKIGEGDDRAWEDIIHDYGFAEKSSIKSDPDFVGKAKVYETSKPKPLSQATEAEWQEWKKQNLKGSVSWAVKKAAI